MALQAALKAVSRRDLTREELTRVLARRGFEEAEVVTAVERLASMGFIDDSRTATFVAEEVKSAPHKGSLAAKLKLERRGIDEIVVDEVMKGFDELSDRAKAAKFVSTRQWKSREQAARALSARGFGEDCIISVIEEHFPVD